MNTTHTRAKRLLVTAIGAAVVGISLAAAPAAVAQAVHTNEGHAAIKADAQPFNSGPLPEPLVAPGPSGHGQPASTKG